MAEHKRKDDGLNDRTCIVTRESGDADALIRFVAGPDGMVVPDLKRQLPGRGCWVKAERALVDKAVAKKLFARALKTEVRAAPDLGAEVDRLLVSQLAGMMNLARKAASYLRDEEKEEEIPAFRFFAEAEMEALLGQNAFIHAAALAGQAGEGVVKRAIMLDRYRNGAKSRALGGDRPLEQ